MILLDLHSLFIFCQIQFSSVFFCFSLITLTMFIFGYNITSVLVILAQKRGNQVFPRLFWCLIMFREVLNASLGGNI